MEITIHTGLAGDQNKIHIEWFDENNKHYKNTLSVNIEPQDKPRTVALILDDTVLANLYRGKLVLR